MILYYIFIFIFIFIYPFHYCSDQVWRLIYCRNYWAFSGYPYDNSFSSNSASNSVSMVFYNRRILVLKNLPGWFNGPAWSFYFIIKNIVLFSLNNKSFISWFLWFFSEHYYNCGYSVFVKYWVVSVSIFVLHAVYLFKPVASHL